MDLEHFGIARSRATSLRRLGDAESWRAIDRTTTFASLARRANNLPGSAMAKTKKQPTLGALCMTAHTDKLFRNPRHLVHPESGELMLFDIRSEAVCPDCGARWRRVLNVIELVSS
jgi:hypothetical protein